MHFKNHFEVLLLAALLGSCAAPNSPTTVQTAKPTPPKPTPITPVNPSTGTGTAVLQQLGVVTNLGGRKNTDGSVMADTDNPFGQDTINVQVQNEIFTISADNKVSLLSAPDVASATLPKALAVNALGSSLDGTVKRPVAADIDGDGKKEIVTVVFSATAKTMSLFLLDNGTEPYTLVNKTPIPLPWTTTRSWSDNRDYYTYWHWAGIVWVNDSMLNQTRDWSQSIDVASGDIDGDGKDEMVLTAEANLYVIDDDYSLKMTQAITPLTGTVANDQILRVACGDMNRDGSAEIVVTNGTAQTGKTATLSLYTYAAGGTLTLRVSDDASAASMSIRTAAVAFGDVDGDKHLEVVLTGIQSSTRACATLVWRPLETKGVWSQSFLPTTKASSLKSQTQNYWTGDWGSGQEADALVPILAVGDLNKDGKDEIVANDDVLALTGTAPNFVLDKAWAKVSSENLLRKDLPAANLPGWGGVWGDFCNSSASWAHDRVPDTAYFNQVKVGDLNGDGYQEIVVLDFLRNKVRTFGYDTVSGEMRKFTDVALTTDDVNGTHQRKFLCLGDVNNDGAIYRYTGHALIFSAPVILGILSSPPFWNIADPNDPTSLIQYTNNMETNFGLGVGASVGIGGSVEVSASGKWGVEVVLPVASNGKVEASVEVTVGFAASFDAEVSGTMTVGYHCPFGTDKVMFTSVPLDVYQFTELADPTKVFYLKVPRPAVMQFTDVDYYNAYNGDYPDVDATVLKNHVIGNPPSYPRLADATSVFDAFPGASFVIKALQKTGGAILPGVPQGDGYTTLEYEVAGSVGSQFSIFGEAKYEQTASFVGMASASAAVKIEGHVSTKINVSTAIGAAVGGLKTAYYNTPGYRYNWGLFVYPYTLSGAPVNQNAVLDANNAVASNFLVVNYWVEPQ